MPIRIGLSGPVGSGKSTLAAALADKLEVPLIAEDWGPIQNAMLRYERAVAERLDPAVRGRRLGEWMESVHDWCRSRAALYDRHQSFVADRWELDAFSHWLIVFSRYLPAPKHTMDARDLFFGAALRFNLAVVLPVATHSVPEYNDVGLRRQTDITLQMLTHTTCQGLLQQLPPGIIKYYPPVPSTIDERTASIVRLVRTRE